MKTFFYLSTCGTCTKIRKELDLPAEVQLRDIKTPNLTAEEVDHMKALAGSYEALFSRRALKFREWGLHEQQLGEADFRRLLMEEYTFLKRPVLVLDDQIFVGNAPAVTAAAKAALASR